MWGKLFMYEKSDNCMVMWFEGKNFNGDVMNKINGDVILLNLRSIVICCFMFFCLVLIFSLIILLLSSFYLLN